MEDEELLRKKNRLAKQAKAKKNKTSATLAGQHAVMAINKRYKRGTKIKVMVNL